MVEVAPLIRELVLWIVHAAMSRRSLDLSTAWGKLAVLLNFLFLVMGAADLFRGVQTKAAKFTWNPWNQALAAFAVALFLGSFLSIVRAGRIRGFNDHAFGLALAIATLAGGLVLAFGIWRRMRAAEHEL